MFINLLRYSLILTIISFLSAPTPAFAYDNPPIPPNKTKALQAFKIRVEEKKKHEQNLKEKVEHIQKELKNTKSELTQLAQKIQKNEDRILVYEKKISGLEIKKSTLEQNLQQDRKSIAKLIRALERIRRYPPEAMIARPESPYKTAQTALLMGDVLPSIAKHAEKLDKNLEILANVSLDLQKQKEESQNTLRTLHKEYERISALAGKRQDLYSSTRTNLEKQETEIRRISLQAKDLEELVDRIKEEEQKYQQAILKEKALKPKPTAPALDNGVRHLPISGIIRLAYHQKDEFGATSKGLTIEGRAGGLVVAPITGKIQFTGNFKRYGNIVIIEHSGGYHSLVAGLDTINGLVGDTVNSGEPIGILPNSSLIPRPTLYYELRKNGKPVNPSEQFSDLG